MQTKNVILAIVAIAVLIVVGYGGYYMGTSGTRTTVDERSGSGTANAQAYSHQGGAGSGLIADLEAKLAESPEDPALLVRVGDAYFQQKRFTEAIDYYKKTLEIVGDDADIYNDIGLSLHYLGNSAEGLDYVEKGIEKNPYHQRIWLTKGFLLAYGLGDIKGAEEAWNKARAIDPESQIGTAASDYLDQIERIKEKRGL